MDRRVLNILSSAVMMTIAAGALIAVGAGIAEAAGNEVLMKGQLVSEECMKSGMLSACYLESASSSPLVLFTNDRKLYKIEPRRVPLWKLDSGFGKQVVVKGTVKGNKILVNDAAPLSGKRKLSKACL